ncbi:hypothetical protein OG280_41320 (plasmid) [Streptomyces virginiae]|uniref:hypothetical protein n=1 Tax=Streptomyces virginiae TaxID=1961 RepID=UPI002DDB4CA4|nr:hypothetical protein [Streptomyces virginiae]WSC82769.1 hypothetical protein OHA56_40940 [Streptomyces virginiae]
MSTPTQGDPFAEAAGEAVETAVMSVRLVMAIADAVRRQQQRRKKGAEEEIPPADEAARNAKEELKDLLPADVSAALLKGADWPQLAQQMMALKAAGVDLEQLLPRIGEIAVSVRDQVAANQERIAAEGNGQWERMLRETLPAGPVREAILSSPTWPDIAATMGRLDERGVDVRQILAAAHDEGLGVDQAVAKVLAAGEAPTTSRDALLSWGPMTEGLDLPKDLDLSDRERALRQVAISPQENARFHRMVREAMPGRERDADLMVAARQWPVVASRMAKMESAGQPVKDHLAGLMKDTSWETGQGSLGTRLLQATSDTLRRPPGTAGTGSRSVVSTAAARAQSSTVGPTKVQPPKGAAPAAAGVAAHREAGPANQGRTR